MFSLIYQTISFSHTLKKGKGTYISLNMNLSVLSLQSAPALKYQMSNIRTRKSTRTPMSNEEAEAENRSRVLQPPSPQPNIHSAQVQLLLFKVLINSPMRASWKKYSPRRSIMGRDINSNGCNPRRSGRE